MTWRERQLLPRGLRNNNPLNIRHSKSKWQGTNCRQEDSQFVTFEAPEWGYRAALKTLRNYQRLHNRTTIRRMVERWAPVEDNNHTDNYIKVVSKLTRLAPDQPIDLYRKEVVVPLLKAMAYVENGVEVDTAPIAKGYDLAT